MREACRAHLTLTLTTLAFTMCFAAWMLNGVLVTWLIDSRVFPWTAGDMGVLIGAPVLTGSVARILTGLFADKYGGRPVFAGLMVVSAVPMFLLSYADDFTSFLLCSAGFGLSGASFAVGIAFTSLWYPKQWQGTALGIFGTGNAGSALTTLVGPWLIGVLTAGGTRLEGWRNLPRLYAAALVVVALVFYLGTTNRRPEGAAQKRLREYLAPLSQARVWRFGLYYFLVFGGFVALAQWLVPYYLNVYGMDLVVAGLMASIFSFPSGVIRALGGFMSDRYGARSTLIWMFLITGACAAALCFPKMDIESPGRGIMAFRGGPVTEVSETAVRVGEETYPLRPRPDAVTAATAGGDESTLVWPVVQTWQEPAVKVGDKVARKQLIARGVTHIYFQANVWVFTFLVFVMGIAMGIGKAAVYRYIPDYFPRDVGVVGGIVGVIGGLGGFVCPIVFGYLLDWVGLWTSTWFFLLGVTVACLAWLSLAIKQVERERKQPAA